MSIEDLIEMVCRLYSRMDKVQDMRIAFSSFLREAHSLDYYRRDIKKSYVLNPTLSNGVLQIDLNTELSAMRRIYSIQTYTSFLQVGTAVYPEGVIITPEAYHEGDPNNLTNYYGVPDRYTWNIMGNSIQIRDVSSNAVCVEISGFGYPTYAANITTGVLETDSWIFKEYQVLLEAYCCKWLTSYLKDAELQNAANTKFYEKRQEFIAAYAQEIVSWR